ncbi:TlpA disulfide reductase family protein [Sphingobacterium athyrii]|uniref:Thioredoxin domain-containing protein n=1 Tax=Sphingobacterium athyrii TaxID=2152717 RepID=A0A363NUL4_9SPHI|nr:TlpA disulfide reductase family protein [Sphingobacterium athyrii]PUV24506.1 hypothetical protein DCO56_14275 [Sphingobacterium athyrii]
MNLKKINLTAILMLLVLFFTTFNSQAQRRSELITDKNQLAKLKAAVEARIDSPKVHEAYIKAMGTENPELEKQYANWIKKYPKSVVVPYSIAEAYLNEESPKAKPYLLKAIAIDPKFADAWNGLSEDADRSGEFTLAQEYLAKATAADPSDPKYAFYYANTFKGVDEEKWKQLSLDVAKRFPDHERGAQALFWLAERSKKVADKLKYFELLHDSYAPEKFNWSASGMSSYYDILLSKDPQKAVELAQKMEKKEKQERKEWSGLLLQAQIVVKAKTLMDQKKGAEALALLNQLKLSKHSSFKTDFVLLKAQANDIAGNTIAAYDSLIVTFTKAPSVALKTAIAGYASKLGKNDSQVDAEIWAKLDSRAQIATPFTNLKRYTSPGTASLADYKGKVVLLTYWFPGCGPCRGEFPHFESVVKRFKGQDLEYLGINIVSSQNEYVLPFLKGSGYSFTPLEDVEGRVKGNLNNGGAAPVNFLIDKEGRLIFSHFRTDGNNEDDLELMISLLLNRK